MSRRAGPVEQQFGSDSFLDVIANIVGILIILIVIVGMKVARQPQDGAGSAAAVAATREPAATVREPAVSASRLLAARDERDDLQSQEAELMARRSDLQNSLPLSERELAELRDTDRQVAAQLADVEQEKNRLDAGRTAAVSEHSRLQVRVARLESEVAENELRLKQTVDAVAVAARQAQRTDDLVRDAVLETQQLYEVMQAEAATAVPRNRLEHRLAPVGERVEGDELHFRIADGRISLIPIQVLLDKLKAQVMARRDALFRFSRYEGVVGPVNGYQMSYVVERDSESMLQALQNGGGGIRISVSRWTITPTSELVTESIDEALRPGSRFRQEIEAAVPESSVTMWIYPESFAAFRPLREMTHGLQLKVAARPLPAGTPIVGSPNGSASTAQ